MAEPVAEPTATWSAVTAEQAGVSFRLPASWQRIEGENADATYADPERRYWRLQVSSYQESRLSAEHQQQRLDELAEWVVGRVPGTLLETSIVPVGDDRAVAEYVIRAEGIAPIRNWWIVRRRGDVLQRTLFTHSILQSHWDTPETRALVDHLRREIESATFPAALATDKDAIGWMASSKENERAIGRLMQLAPAEHLGVGDAPQFAPDVLETARELYSGITTSLKPHHLTPDPARTLGFAIAIHAAWLTGSQAPSRTVTPFELALAAAVASSADESVVDVTARYHASRDRDVTLVRDWMDALFRGSKGYANRFKHEAAMLRTVGIDTRVARDAKGAEREPWIAAAAVVSTAVQDAARRSYTRLTAGH